VIYIAPIKKAAKVSEENQGPLGMGAKGQGRLTESSTGSLRLVSLGVLIVFTSLTLIVLFVFIYYIS